MSDRNRRCIEFRKGIGRARTLFRGVLGMFPGFPLELSSPLDAQDRSSNHPPAIRWQSVPLAFQDSFQQQIIDGEKLRSMCAAVQQLQTVYRPHLEFVCDCSDEWLARMESALNLLAKLHSNELHLGTAKFGSPSATEELALFKTLTNATPLEGRWLKQVRQVAFRHPKLCPLLTAIVWISLTCPDEIVPLDLNWIEQNADLISDVRHSDPSGKLQLQLTFCLLQPAVDERWLSFLLRVIANDCLSQQPFESEFGYVRNLHTAWTQARSEQKSVEIPDRPQICCGTKVNVLLSGMLAMPRAQLTAYSRLFGELVDQVWIDEDIERVVEANNFEQQISHHLRKMARVGFKEYQLHSDAAKLAVLTEFPSNLALPFHVGRILNYAIGMYIWREHRDSLRKLRLLAKSMETMGSEVRLQWFEHLQGNVRTQYDFNRFAQFSVCLARLIDRRGLHENLRKLLEATATSRECWTTTWFARHLEAKTCIAMLDLLATLIYDHDIAVTTQIASEIAFVCDTPNDRSWNLKLLQARIQTAKPIHDCDNHLVLARWLDPNCERPFEFIDAFSSNDELCSALKEINQVDIDPWLLTTIREQLLAGKHQLPLQIGSIASIVRAVDSLVQSVIPRATESVDMNIEPCEPPSSAEVNQTAEVNQSANLSASASSVLFENSTDSNARAYDLAWIDDFPEPLRQPLKRLALILGTRAIRWADRQLGKDCPRRELLEAQISQLVSLENRQPLESIEGTPPSDQGSKVSARSVRLSKLQEWCNHRPTISPARIAKLVDKIEHRILVAAVERFRAQKLGSVNDKLRSLGLTRNIDRLFIHPYSQILPGLAGVEKSLRELGLRVLAKGLDDPTQFLSEPANRGFIRRMQASGIDMQPWLQPTIALGGSRHDGTEYKVAFAKHSLDIFLMGFHFQTCLSPCQFNFFSTIANVADVNKRVLYGLTENGSVVGRCLICLTNSGEIQSFHRYQHDSRDGFEEKVGEFLALLCQAMGTKVTDRGRVARLVVHRWYDDGCLPIKTDSDDSMIRVWAILNDKNELAPIAKCQQLLGDRKKITANFLDIAEFIARNRPELASDGLKWLDAEPTNGLLEARLLLTAVALQSSEKDRMISELKTVSLEDIHRRLSRHRINWLLSYPEVGELLIRQTPVAARRLMIVTRPRHVRSDLDETDIHRRALLARIHERLHRENNVKRLQPGKIH